MKDLRSRAILAWLATLILVASGTGVRADSTPVQLSFWSGFTGGNAAGFKAMIDAFNQSHPDIQVTMDAQPWDTIAQKLPTAIAAGSGPDLATPDFNQATVLQYASNGLALPLTSVFGDGPGQVAKDVIPVDVLKSSTIDGTIYSAPATLTTIMLYYNASLLDAAGIKSPPATIAELQDDAVKLTANGVYGLALADHSTIANWPELVWADGGDIVRNGCSALTDDATVQSLSRWADLIVNKQVTQVGLSGQDASNLFSAGKAAFVINGPNAAPAFAKAGVNFKVAPLPVGASNTPVTLASTIPLIVSAKTAHPAEAQQFVAWWLSAAAQKQLALQTGAGPARVDVADDPDLKANAMLQAFATQAQYGRLLLPTEPQFNEINNTIFLPAIQAIERGADVKATLTSAGAQLNTLLGCK